MFSNVLVKTMYEKRWTLFAWSVALFAMTLLTMSFYPYFKNSGFEQIVSQAPKSLQGVLGQAANYKSVPGYVDQQIFALRMPLLTIIMAVTLFVGVGVADEDKGTLETLLAQPVTRSSVFWQKYAAGAILLAIAHLFIILGVMASYPFIHGSMNSINLLAATFGCWLLTMAFATVTYAFGAATGKRGLTIGIASALAFFGYLISSLAPAVEKLSRLQKLTPFYYYNTPPIGMNGLRLAHVGLFVGFCALLCLVSMVIFRNRDLIRD